MASLGSCPVYNQVVDGHVLVVLKGLVLVVSPVFDGGTFRYSILLAQNEDAEILAVFQRTVGILAANEIAQVKGQG